ncbi:MAG: 16S rRNA (cytidine(1402)-2'-O)-methyltransferase [bacterium]
MTSGKLFLVATPIGNLEDITLRALRILQEVDIIFCEDTKTSVKLINHYQIKKPLQSYYKPKEREKLSLMLSLLKEGKKLALISDAGMPLISDPGQLLVKSVREAGYEIECVPGPSSVLMAIALSGLSTERFIFEGFLPKQKGSLEKRLEEIKDLPHTTVFFVPARDIFKTLGTIKEIMGDRKLCIAKELTKFHEEVIVTTISSFLEEKRVLKGEVTVVVEGAKEKKTTLDIEEIKELLLKEQKSGKTFKDVLKDGKLKMYPKNLVYDLWEEVKDGKGKD